MKRVRLLIRTTLSIAVIVALLSGCSNNSKEQNTSTSTSQESGISYYIDAENGDDSKDGLSKEAAWKTLNNVKSKTFQPGDKVLFKANTEYHDQLKISGSGTKEAPIEISMYGEGEKPVFHGDGKFDDAILITNQDHIKVKNLACTNTGDSAATYRTGMRVLADNYGTMHNIHLDGIYVYDVNGSLKKKDEAEGTGLLFTNKGDSVKSRFNELLIENCHLKHVDRNGLCGFSAHYYRDSSWYPNIGVVIRHNLLEDIGGDAIKPWGCVGALVEYNTVHYARQRTKGHAAGIWPWSCDNTIIQYNEVSHMKGAWDGQGFDSDYNSRNTLFQYNYSHDNEGGFMLVCSPSPKTWNISTNNTIIRYNISQNDGNRTFHMAGQSSNTIVYNNIFYIKPGMKVTAFLFGDWEGWADRLFVRNNIFYADSGATFDYRHGTGPVQPDGTYPSEPGEGPSTNNFYNSNVFYGDHVNTPIDKFAITENPMLVAPGTGKDGLESLDGYKLKEGSPCIDKGLYLDSDIKTDFFGEAMDLDPDIGVDNFNK